MLMTWLEFSGERNAGYQEMLLSTRIRVIEKCDMVKQGQTSNIILVAANKIWIWV
jgi:hypothetical protein